MKAYFRLFKQFILRALTREKLRSSFTALGISLGVGVMVAIRLANASALDSFKAATESIAGETSIQISGVAGRFDELKLRDLHWLRDYGQVSPVIEGYALTASEVTGRESEVKRQESETGKQKSASRNQQPSAQEASSQTAQPAKNANVRQTPNSAPQSANSNAETKDQGRGAADKEQGTTDNGQEAKDSPGDGEFIQILGVDVLRDRSLRKYQLLEFTDDGKTPTTRDFLLLLTDAQAIVITEKFARKHGLAIGDSLPLILGDRQHEFIIRGLLREAGFTLP